MANYDTMRSRLSEHLSTLNEAELAVFDPEAGKLFAERAPVSSVRGDRPLSLFSDPPTRPWTLAVLLRPLPRYNKIVPNTPVSLLLKRKMSAPTGEATLSSSGSG